ncbi:MAG TPA: cytochrome c [Acidimicrobiia bacterium]|nr:cytochrome c [Acidimicrobiia bacterium]
MRRFLVLVLVVAVVAACGGGSESTEIDPIRRGRTVYGDTCSVCHGTGGQGGVGPSLTDVVETWPSCADHIEWVTIGSNAWKEIHGDTYGATNRENTGAMPGQEDTMSPSDVAAVSAYERVTYGGQDRDAALADCGIAAE